MLGDAEATGVLVLEAVGDRAACDVVALALPLGGVAGAVDEGVVVVDVELLRASRLRRPLNLLGAPKTSAVKLSKSRACRADLGALPTRRMAAGWGSFLGICPKTIANGVVNGRERKTRQLVFGQHSCKDRRVASDVKFLKCLCRLAAGFQP